MPLDSALRERLEALIGQHDVVLFMKGTRERPQCGFSATVVALLDELVPDYATVDVLADPEVRDGIKELASWPTIPQLYVRGEFVGGCDIVREMAGTGELHARLGVPYEPPRPPRLEVTEEAAGTLREILAAAPPDRVLHLRVDPRFENTLYTGPPEPGTLAVESHGVPIHVDAGTARRADGLRIDLVRTPEGPGFRIDNPNAPRAVAQIAPKALAEWIGSGEPVRVIDVRPAEERARAPFPGAEPLEPQTAAALEQLDRATPLVFVCHHGERSQAAAEHFRALGFERVANLAGGIDAWSREVDPSVPRY